MSLSAASPDRTYADPAALVIAALDALLPPDPISTADYAREHRWLFNEGGGYVGPWLHEMAPYLVEPMEALDSHDYLDVAVVGPGQSGKTSIAENWMLKSVGADPANFLWYMQTDEALKHYVKTTINPMIEQHEVLKSRLGLNPIDDSLGFKRFRSMSVSFLPATYSNLISKKAPRIVNDEPDAALESLGEVRDLMDIRRTTYGSDSKILSLSHPDRARSVAEEGWTAGIMKLFRDSDRRLWWWPCPHCGEYSSPNPTASLVMSLNYPPEGTLSEIREKTRLECPSCHALIEDHERRSMNLAGKWVGLGQTIGPDGVISGARERRKTAGFWIVGLMSPFLIQGIGGLAADLVAADRDRIATGEDKALREATVKKFGVPYTPPRRVAALDAEMLAAKAEPELKIGVVPSWVRFLTAFIDVQANRFEWLVRGWGRDGESTVIDHRRVLADAATSQADWDDLLKSIALAAYPLQDDPAGRVMRVYAIGYDSGGQAGVTSQAYTAWARARGRGQVRLPSLVDGREAWRLLPTKGMPRVTAQKLAIVYPDSGRKDRKAGARGQIPTAQFNANLFKDDLALHLGCGAPGPWMLHLPRDPTENLLRKDADAETRLAARKAWFAQLTAEQRTPAGAWVEVTSNARNEVWDLLVGSHVMAHLHGLARLRWDTPLAWYAPWDRNSMVSAPPDSAPAPAPTPATVIAPKPDDAPVVRRSLRSIAAALR